MSTAQRLNAYLRTLAGGAACASVLAAAPFAWADLSPGTVDGDPTPAGFNILTDNAIPQNNNGGPGGTWQGTGSPAIVANSLINSSLVNNATTTVLAGPGGGELGDLTLAVTGPLDFNGAGGRTLILGAANSIVLHGPITDSDANESLNLDLEADATGAGQPAGGLIVLNAPLALGSGYLDAEGKGFDNTGTVPGSATIAAGNFDLDIDGSVTIGSDVTAAAVQLETWAAGAVNLNASVTTTGAFNSKAAGAGASTFTLAAGESLQAGGAVVLDQNAAVELNGTVTGVGVRTDGTDLTVNAALAAGTGNVLLSQDGAVAVNAAVTGAAITSTGTTFTSTATGTLTTAGAVSLQHSGLVTLGAAVSGATFESTGTGGLTTNATVTAAGGVSIDHGGAVQLNQNVTSTGGTATFAGAGALDVNAAVNAANIVFNGSGNIDTTGGTLTAANTVTLNQTSASTRFGALSAQTLALSQNQRLAASDATVSTVNIGSNTLTLLSGANVETTTVSQSGSGKVVISGGRFQGPAASYVRFDWGTFATAEDLYLYPGAPLETVLGTNPTLTNNQELEVQGTIFLGKPITLSGGTLTAAHIDGVAGLNFGTGRVNLTGEDLVVGGGGQFGALLTIDEGQTFSTTGAFGVDIAGGSGGGQVTVAGGALHSAGPLTNDGVLRLTTTVTPAEVSGGTLVNGAGGAEATITGKGNILSSSVTNAAHGTIRVQAGDNLYFANPVNNNGGRISFEGGQVRFGGQVNNAAAGRISGSEGTLRFANSPVQPDADLVTPGNQPAAGLVNSGLLQITGVGVTNVFGTIFQAGTTAKIQVTGGAVANFQNDVFNYHGGIGAAEINVDGASSATFFGLVKGNGTITGQGVKFFENGLSPGESPGQMSIEGNVSLGDANTLIIELGGAAPGTQYDVLSVGGQLTLGGTLQVELLDGYVPQAGDTFNIISAGALVGSFRGFDFGGLQLTPVVSGNALSLTVVPEPATAALALLGVALLAPRRRRA